MVEVVRYTCEKKMEWDNFVDTAKNGTFLFKRDYMDYHANRFEDFSLMLYDKGKLKSVFVGHKVGVTFYSHQGLTFGGIVTLYETDALRYIEYFNCYSSYLKSNGISDVIYKAIPQIYKTHLSEEELYIMYRLKAELISSNLSSCIDLQKDRITSRLRKRKYNKSLHMGLRTKKSEKWQQFWDIMIENMLLQYNAKPVHTCEEIMLLHSRFSNNIVLLESSSDDVILAGGVLYLYQDVIKVQYAHASPEGKENGAIDNLYNYIFTNFKSKFRYVDFGTSNLNCGNYINEGLLRQKEGFGARGIVFNMYKYNTDTVIE